MSIIGEHLISGLLDGLTALVKDEVTMLWGVKGEIERLQKKFLLINAILADAERKKIQSEAINLWLKKLKDIMFDADDILDECRTEVVEKSKVAVSSGHQDSTSSCFSKIVFAHQIGRRIKHLNRRLDDIVTEKSQYHLQSSSARLDDHQSISLVSRKSSSIPEPDIVGSNIEKDTEKLVELLIKEDTRENILVYSIVGIGGIGKTTLARKVFNDEKISTNFSMKSWVCVSKDFEETSLLREIIEDKEGGHRSRAQLEIEVQNRVANKKFLLVLDDLWDAKVWNDLLRNPLQGVAAGSRVLMTTRNEGIGRQMKAVAPLHKVEILSADDGWALLSKKVILSGEEREVEDLKDIGKEIVDRCGGLPLVIKTIGGVLSTKSTNKKEWEKVLKTLSNGAWTSSTNFLKEVQPALFLSYEDLPSHLKQCFLYCSLFPEDYVFNRQELIRYWISEGFVHEEGEGGLTLEELGEDYFWDLVQRSFFQLHPSMDEGFIVHDLLWSLARNLAGDENLVMKDGVELVLDGLSPVKPRRLQGYFWNDQAFSDALKGHDSLRTLLINESTVQRNFVKNLIKKTPRLRVLALSISFLLPPATMYEVIKLPKSLGGLIHLRFLDLSLYQVSEVPVSIGNLVNLQFLILKGCNSLRSLPRSIGKLHNLRCLELYGASERLEGIPIEIADLHQLNTLTNFVVRHNNNMKGLSTLQELGSLENLRKLVISHLWRALNKGEVGRVNALRNMKKLQELELSCTSYPRVDDYGEEDIKRMEEILEVMLCPPPHLESLIIQGFFGLHYPSWIGKLSGLRWLNLSWSHNCPNLRPLGKLPNLDYLEINCAYAVEKIGTEFLGQEADSSRDGGGRMQISFPKLTTLKFFNMPKWEEWEWEVKDDDRLIVLPNLKKLVLIHCSNLRSLPSGLARHATTLTNLDIFNCESLKAIRGFSSIKELKIDEACSLDDVSDLPSLKTMKLVDRDMQSLPEWFDEGGHKFPALHKLEIEASDQLLRRCLKDGLDWPKIEHIPYVYASSPFQSVKYISKSPFAFSTNLNDHPEDV